MTISEYCNGCPESVNTNSNCYYSKLINIDGDCPCINCIVKPMCEQSCYGLEVYAEEIINRAGDDDD